MHLVLGREFLEDTRHIYHTPSVMDVTSIMLRLKREVEF